MRVPIGGPHVPMSQVEFQIYFLFILVSYMLVNFHCQPFSYYIGALDKGSPMSHVDSKKSQCPMSLNLSCPMHVVFKIP